MALAMTYRFRSTVEVICELCLQIKTCKKITFGRERILHTHHLLKKKNGISIFDTVERPWPPFYFCADAIGLPIEEGWEFLSLVHFSMCC